MKTTKLTLNEIYSLHFELVGFEDKKGLLSQPLPMKVKYWLDRLAKVTTSEVKSIDDLRNELIKELGEEVDGQIQIKIGSENMAIFNEKFNELISVEKDIEHALFTFEQFENVESSEFYGTFFKLIEPPNEA